MKLYVQAVGFGLLLLFCTVAIGEDPSNECDQLLVPGTTIPLDQVNAKIIRCFIINELERSPEKFQEIRDLINIAPESITADIRYSPKSHEIVWYVRTKNERQLTEDEDELATEKLKSILDNAIGQSGHTDTAVHNLLIDNSTIDIIGHGGNIAPRPLLPIVTLRAFSDGNGTTIEAELSQPSSEDVRIVLGFPSDTLPYDRNFKASSLDIEIPPGELKGSVTVPQLPGGNIRSSFLRVTDLKGAVIPFGGGIVELGPADGTRGRLRSESVENTVAVTGSPCHCVATPSTCPHYSRRRHRW